MAVWAYECRPCGDGGGTWWVARGLVDALPAEVSVLRVKVRADWRCATVDRSRPVAIEAQLLREAVASDLQDCPECAARTQAPPQAAREVPAAVASQQLQAAAISIAGRRMLVVLVGLDLARSPGEAGMLIADLRARFNGVDIVLMGQDDEGVPHYHGDAALVDLLAEVPVEQMPWKAYPVR